MLCEICGERQATIHYTKIINGQKEESHICEVCAKSNSDSVSKFQDFSFNQLLSGLLDFDQFTKGSGYTDTHNERCMTCGLTFAQFKQLGKFGCSDCYKSFGSKLEPIFRRIHGNNRHNGKVPIRTGENFLHKKELNKLKEELKQNIVLENFEEAAKIRDKIKNAESKISIDEVNSNG
ncbi:MAG: UvrB/UvrC motif-containing protein [Vulcanibacillus sp.]